MSDDFAIESRFTLEERVGRGGSGDVHRGRDRETGALVAVKRLLSKRGDAVLVDRFRREARLLAQIDHPHVLKYVAYGVDREDTPCLVVEWLEGEDVAQRQRRQPLTVAEALDVAHQAATGLHALHDAGIVHRDVKPSNLYLVARGDEKIHLKVIDLGVARAAGEATLTTEGNMIGTPFYMAPEQVRGEERITSLADQFALGAVVFELISGRRAFTGEEVFAVLAKIILADPPRLRDVLPGVPAQLDALVRRAMSKSPAERFPSMRELAFEIAAVARWTPTASPPAAVDQGEEDDAPTRVARMSSTSERRVVTAVFAGFAPASRDDALGAFEGLVAQHGAASFRTLGRRVIAVFGSDRTTGDEAVRAARACVAASQRIPGIRLAIATGRAIAGVTGLSGELIERGARVVGRGDALDLGPRPIRIDETTAELLAEHFVVEGPPEGRVLAALRPSAAPPRTLVGKPTPCVGRDRELGQLDATFAECVSDQIARAVLVTGPAGIGKSRLRYEMLARLGRQPVKPEVLLARGSPLAEASAFGLLGPALRRLAGIGGGEAPAVQRRKLNERLCRYAPAHVVGPLAELAWIAESDGRTGSGPPRDAMASGDRMRAAWIDWLTAETSHRPMVLVLEDLHWGDLASVLFVDAALRALEARRIFVVAFAREEVRERFPTLWSARGLQELRLGPLTPRAAERLAHAALGQDADPGTIQKIVSRGEGNAFYVEELIRAAAEGAGDALPDSVLGMVQARLDALGAGPKRLLRAASVFGEVFWRGGVAALTGDDGAASDGLDRLVALEIVSRRTATTFPGEEEYVFRHALVREAAYAMIPDVDRRAGHRTAGLWLEGAGEVDPALLAAHFERGGDQGRAAGLFLRAALAALAGHDFAGAVALAERCLALDEPERAGGPGAAAPGLRGRARLVQAEAHRWSGDLGAAARAATEAAGLLPRGTHVWFHAMRERIGATGRLGQLDQVGWCAEEVLACDAGQDAEGARIACLAPATAHFFYAGKTGEATRLLDRIEALERAGSSPDPSVAARLHQLRAVRADIEGAMETALTHHLSAVTSFELAGDLRGACQSWGNAGFVHAALGDYTRAEHALRRAHEGAQRMGLGPVMAFANHNLGFVLAALGRFDEAERVERTAMESFQASGDPRLETGCRVYLSRILLAAGDVVGAEIEARIASESAAAPAPMRAGGLASHARALLASGRTEEALAAATRAAAELDRVGAMEDFGTLVGIAHAEALDASGDRAGAMRAIGAAHERLLTRANRLREPARTRYLEDVPDNARCVSLARRWGVVDAGGRRLTPP